jgi:hypothetical protein
MKFEGQIEGSEINPRAARTGVSFDVLVRCAEGEVEARVVNLSAKGFRLRSTWALEPGWEITLEVAKLPPAKALVRWVAGLEAGGVFTEPVIL